MKKFILKILLVACFACGAGACVAFSSCEKSPEETKTEQPNGDSNQDEPKNEPNDGLDDDSNNDSSGGGIWTPPVKEN